MGCKKQMCSPKRVISNTQTTTTKERTMPRICIPSSYLKAQAMLQGTTWWRRRWGDAGVQDQCPCCPRTWESGLPAGRWFGGHSCTPGSIKSSNTKFSLQWNSSLKHQATVVLREGCLWARVLLFTVRTWRERFQKTRPQMWGGRSQGWSLSRWFFIRGIFPQGALIIVVSQRDGLASGWSLRMVCQGGLSSGWSHHGGLSSMVFHHGGLSSGWSFTDMVSHQGHLSSGWCTCMFYQGDL